MKHLLITACLLALTPTLVLAQETKPAPPSAKEFAIEKAPAGAYTLDKTHASLTWKVSHLGLSNYTARFTNFDAKLNLNPTDPTKSTLLVSVDPTSVETDFPNAAVKDFDAELAKGEQWFNASKFPEIKFEATKIEKLTANTGLITGNLTFLGVTKPLVLNTTYNGGYALKPFGAGPALGFSATATLKRSDWGFATYVPMIGDDVTLLIEVEFDQATPSPAAKN